MLRLIACLAAFAAVHAGRPVKHHSSVKGGTADTNYLVGTGIYDITGPAAEVNLMGYAMLAQTAKGIHNRQRARSFIIADSQNPTQRVVICPLDLGMGSDIVNKRVIEKLQKLYGPQLYTHANVILSGSHTHGGAAGFLQYVLYEVTSLGMVNQTMNAVVEGIYQSIVRAHNDLQPASIFMNQGQLYNASRNRSPTSYLRNPERERAMYEMDTDNDMVVLKFVNAHGEDFAMLNWFAVHGTSMNNTNRRLTSDNKGYAEYMFEAWKNGAKVRPGKGKYVAGFAQSNLGDISPNTRGAFCHDTGLPCEPYHSTCNGLNALCWAEGPGVSPMDSTRIIGERQYKRARELYENAITPIKGSVDFRHTFANMSQQPVPLSAGGNRSYTCLPAMGYGFAAGTTDGPGAFDFVQGNTSSNPFWNLVSSVLSKPTAEDIACHWPKPILLNTGKVKWPYEWDPEIVPVQIVRVGQLVIAAPPGEMTVMAGRRLKRQLVAKFGASVTVVIMGLANTYSSYITTFEEYQAQRYEAASTIFGPHTLTAYLQIFDRLANAMVSGTPVPPGTPPPDLSAHQWELLPPVVADTVPLGLKFGAVFKDVRPLYRVGETVEVTFWSANPRNDLMTERSFLYVELKAANGEWEVILDDGDWDTIYDWDRPSVSESHATITWNIGQTDLGLNVQAGEYRIRHVGAAKPILSPVIHFEGVSSTFRVIA